MTKEPTKTYVVATMLFGYIFWLCFAGIVLLAVPVFHAMYKDFGAKLPSPTMFCINASAFVRSGYLLIGPLFGGALVAAFFALKDSKSRFRLLLFPGSAAVVIILWVVAMFLPVFVR